MANVDPVWSENNLIPQVVILDQSRQQAQLDLRAAHGAYVAARIGRRSLGTPTIVVQPRVTVTRRGAEAISDHRGLYTAELFQASGSYVISKLIADSATGSVQIQVDQVGYGTGDVIIIQAPGTTVPATCEWNKILRLSGTGTFNLEWPLRFAHFAAPVERVTNGATMFPPIWLPGGASYDVSIYNEDTGNRIVGQVEVQVYDNDVVV